ncbi:TetR/AcrR family transcriptional regulator [Mucilaginibacter koreensis]
MSKASNTRLMILQKSFDLVYERGFQATSIDDIIATTQVTKGAFFYHFKNKEDMGLALIKEVMQPNMLPFMTASLQKTGNIRTDIYEMMKSLLHAPFFKVAYGCPAMNMIEEMAPLNAAFQAALSKLVLQWQQALEQAIQEAQKQGQLNPNHNAKHIAMYISANYSGARNMGKVFGKSAYISFLKEFKKYTSQLA